MRVASSASAQVDAGTAVRDASAVLRATLGEEPDFVAAYFSADYDAVALLAELETQFPNAQLHGATSCTGVMTEMGYVGHSGSGLGLFGVSDPRGFYGTSAAPLSLGVHEATLQALRQALAAADMVGARPDLIWLNSSPGCEEQVLATIRDEIGPDVPVIGGSAADNTIEGRWLLCARDFRAAEAVVITAMFPSGRFAYAFHSGYAPTARHGTVTRATGRTMYEIDNRPAAEIYDEWTQGSIAQERNGGGVILASTTLHPLGRVAHRIQGIPYYKISHPETATVDGGLTLFTDVAVGDEMHLLAGSRDSLIERAGRVANNAVGSVFDGADGVSGALVVYCAGCMLAVRDQMDEVVASIDGALGGKPFLGLFTFGEQGCFVGGDNHHGNLMISILVFGR
jgi:hypothetical protein